MLFAGRHIVHISYFCIFIGLSKAYKSSHILCIMGKHTMQHRNHDISVGDSGTTTIFPLPISSLPHPDVKAFSSKTLFYIDPLLIRKTRFVPADAYWNLAMAVNVYLTLFKKYNAQQLKAVEWKYHLTCYGGPFVVALTLLFVETQSRGKVYGDATVCYNSKFQLPLLTPALSCGAG